MVNVAYIKIWNELIGAIAYDATTGISSFEFDPTFLKHNWDLSPIKMPLLNSNKQIFSFPELRNSQTFRGLPGLLADILPDRYGNTLINTWLSKQGRPTNSLNPVETLCFIGSRGIGAIEIEPAFPKDIQKASKLEISSLIEISEQILSGRKNFSANLTENEEKALIDILKIGTSAGGARAKAIISFDPESNEIRSGQADVPKGFSQWLIKFDRVTDQQFGVSSGYGRVEMAYYYMAIDADIEMNECYLLEENNRAHFMTKRFDRSPNNEKVHMQSFCALQHYDFNEVGMYSYEQLFETMRLLGLPYPQAEQIYRRMVFNVMARNCDDHTKNFAFLMDKAGKWRISPAYDICHAYRPGSEWVSKHALSINGKRSEFDKSDLLNVAQQMNIKKARQIIEQIADTVSNWGFYADKVNVDKPLKNAISKTLLILK
jgi:serine/threonine-protein kinase HipA